MKVLFISRATLFTTRGGDTIQMEKTASALIKAGVEVTTELADNTNIDYIQYDLIHFFNIIRPADIMYHIDNSNLPFVVSPIYLEYKEQTRNNKQGIRDYILDMLGKNVQEYLKSIGRLLMNGESIVSYKYLLMGHKKSIEYILKRCSMLLPNSYSEYSRLKADFKLAGAYIVVPNSVDIDTYIVSEKELTEKGENSVLCVARFEPRKNQLNLIKAIEGTNYKLTFTGNVAPNHKKYYKKCRKTAGDNVRFLDFVTQEELITLYKTHKVHVLPSWFETTGLSSLEAAVMGCNIVITSFGDTEEYFQDNAFYCNPESPGSIRKNIDKAMQAPVNEKFIQAIKEKYNWLATAEATIEAYKKVLTK